MADDDNSNELVTALEDVGEAPGSEVVAAEAADENPTPPAPARSASGGAPAPSQGGRVWPSNHPTHLVPLRGGHPTFPNSTVPVTTNPSDEYSFRRTRGLLALGLGFQLALKPSVLITPGHMLGARVAMGRRVQQEEFVPEYEGDHKDVLEWAFPLLRQMLAYYKGPGSPRPVISSPDGGAADGGELPGTPRASAQGQDGGASGPPRGPPSRTREPNEWPPEAGE